MAEVFLSARHERKRKKRTRSNVYISRLKTSFHLTLMGLLRYGEFKTPPGERQLSFSNRYFPGICVVTGCPIQFHLVPSALNVYVYSLEFSCMLESAISYFTGAVLAGQRVPPIRSGQRINNCRVISLATRKQLHANVYIRPFVR